MVTSARRNADGQQMKRFVRAVLERFKPEALEALKEIRVAVGAVYGFLYGFLGPMTMSLLWRTKSPKRIPLVASPFDVQR